MNKFYGVSTTNARPFIKVHRNSKIKTMKLMLRKYNKIFKQYLQYNENNNAECYLGQLKQLSTTFYYDVEINLPNVNTTKAGTFK